MRKVRLGYVLLPIALAGAVLGIGEAARFLTPPSAWPTHSDQPSNLLASRSPGPRTGDELRNTKPGYEPPLDLGLCVKCGGDTGPLDAQPALGDDGRDDVPLAVLQPGMILDAAALGPVDSAGGYIGYTGGGGYGGAGGGSSGGGGGGSGGGGGGSGSGGTDVPTVPIVPTTPVSPVPEPATWAMMVAGFGLVGAAMRRPLLVGTV
jgi:uncharacterized membrane protein YgcG